MKIKNAFQIFFKNYSLVLKVAITQLIVLALLVGVGSIFVNDIVVNVETGLVQFGVIDRLNAVFAEITSGEFSVEQFNVLLEELRQSISDWAGEVDFFYQKLALSGFALFLFFIITTYCLNFYAVPFTQNISDFMSTSAKVPFFWRFCKSFGKSAKTQLIYILGPFLLDAFILFGVIGLYSLVLSYSGLAGLVITAIILIVMVSLRKTLFAFWLPAMAVNQLPPMASMREGVKMIADGFGRVFWRILLVTLFTYALITVFLFGVVNLVTIIIAAFFMMHNELFIHTVSMVEYYRQSNFGFYIDEMKAVDINEAK